MENTIPEAFKKTQKIAQLADFFDSRIVHTPEPKPYVINFYGFPLCSSIRETLHLGPIFLNLDLKVLNPNIFFLHGREGEVYSCNT